MAIAFDRRPLNRQPQSTSTEVATEVESPALPSLSEPAKETALFSTHISERINDAIDSGITPENAANILRDIGRNPEVAAEVLKDVNAAVETHASDPSHTLAAVVGTVLAKSQENDPLLGQQNQDKDLISTLAGVTAASTLLSSGQDKEGDKTKALVAAALIAAALAAEENLKKEAEKQEKIDQERSELTANDNPQVAAVIASELPQDASPAQVEAVVRRVLAREAAKEAAEKNKETA